MTSSAPPQTRAGGRALVSGLRRVLPLFVFRLVASLQGKEYRLPAGRVRWGEFRRREPLSRCFGFDRGTPIDRYYIEGFLQRNAADVQGRVLEVMNDVYTRRFGGNRVTRNDVLDIDSTNAAATIVADLADGEGIPSDAFDCIILTQVLQLIYDAPAAIDTIYRALRPGGVLLMTVPGITQMTYRELGHTWFWSFSEASARRLLNASFPAEAVSIEKHGNLLAATAMLRGVTLEDVRPSELDACDPDYQVVLAIRAVKPAARELR